MSKIPKPQQQLSKQKSPTARNDKQTSLPLTAVLQQVKSNPHSVSPQAVLQLQKTIGNRAVCNLLSNQPVVQRAQDQEQANKGYEKAKARHEANRKVLFDLVMNPKAHNDKVLENSVKWFQIAKLNLYALTETHDTEKRAKDLGKNGEVAYFSYPKNNIFGDSLDPLYNATYTSQGEAGENVKCFSWSVLGCNIGSGSGGEDVVIMEPARKNKTEVIETLKHEVQHSADRHRVPPVNRHGANSDIETYKTEYSAHLMEGSSKYSNSDEKKKFSWLSSSISNASKYEWTERQYSIFEQIYNNYSDLKKAWNEDENFRKAVGEFNKLRQSEVTVNPTNSYYLDLCYDILKELETINPKLENHPKVLELFKYLPDNKVEAEALENSVILKNCETKLNTYVRRAIRSKLSHVTGTQLPDDLNFEFSKGNTLHMREFSELFKPAKVSGSKVAPEIEQKLQELAKQCTAEEAKLIYESDDWRYAGELAEARADFDAQLGDDPEKTRGEYLIYYFSLYEDTLHTEYESLRKRGLVKEAKEIDKIEKEDVIANHPDYKEYYRALTAWEKVWEKCLKKTIVLSKPGYEKLDQLLRNKK